MVQRPTGGGDEMSAMNMTIIHAIATIETIKITAKSRLKTPENRASTSYHHNAAAVAVDTASNATANAANAANAAAT